jgi:hypothetical protein
MYQSIGSGCWEQTAADDNRRDPEAARDEVPEAAGLVQYLTGDEYLLGRLARGTSSVDAGSRKRVLEVRTRARRGGTWAAGRRAVTLASSSSRSSIWRGHPRYHLATSRPCRPACDAKSPQGRLDGLLPKRLHDPGVALRRSWQAHDAIDWSRRQVHGLVPPKIAGRDAERGKHKVGRCSVWWPDASGRGRYRWLSGRIRACAGVPSGRGFRRRYARLRGV